MEKGEINSENISQVDPETRREIFEDLKVKLTTSLEKRHLSYSRFLLSSNVETGVKTEEIRARETTYKLTRNVNNQEIEITIDRTGQRDDKPSVILESIRFKFGRFTLAPEDPLMEYHRTLRPGGSRTINNSVLAIKRINKFVDEMGKSLSKIT